MAVFHNLKGTLNDQFRIGKNGPSFQQSGNDLDIVTNGTVNVDAVAVTSISVNNVAFTPFVVPITTNTSTSYTLVISDVYVRSSNASDQLITIPTNANVAFPVGTQINIVQAGVGIVTVAGAGGVTLLYPETNIARKQGSVICITKVDTDSWDLVGDTTLAT